MLLLIDLKTFSHWKFIRNKSLYFELIMDAKYCISDYVDKFNLKLIKIRKKYGSKNVEGKL